MEQTEKFRGISRAEIAPLVEKDPQMMKEVVPLGSRNIMMMAIPVVILWLWALIYTFTSQRFNEALPLAFYYSLFFMIILGAIWVFAYMRRNTEDRLKAADFATELEITHDSSNLSRILIKTAVPQSWQNAKSPSKMVLGTVELNYLRFVKYASGHHALFSRTRTTGAFAGGKGSGSHYELPHMVLENDEANRLISLLGTLKNMDAPASPETRQFLNDFQKSTETVPVATFYFPK